MKKPKQVETTFSVYKINSVIGQGGSGIVYGAQDENGNLFAIKSLDPAVATKDKMKRFENEYRFCSRNKHKNIITVLDHGLTSDNAPFFVMPLFDSSLRSLIGNLNPKQSMEIFIEILDGVEAAHKLGVVHRDLKPENILIRNKGVETVIADFGIAEFEEEELYTAVETKDGTRLANFQYAAPEQRTRGKVVDKRTDIYALGLILNELFTAEIPHGTNYKKINSVSQNYPYLDDLVEKILEQNPVGRFSCIDDLKKELIAQGEEYITRQKISQLEAIVIPETEVDDVLIADPIKIVNVDWENNILTIKLNHPVNQNWVWAIKNMGNYTSVMGKGPEYFQFKGNIALVSASSNEAQQVINYFKEWLPKANQVYEIKLKQDQEAEECRQRQELKNRIQKERERAGVLQKLKF